VPNSGVGGTQIVPISAAQHGGLYYARKRRKAKAAVFTLLAKKTFIMGLTMTRCILQVH
jgi:hypothetical protein